MRTGEKVSTIIFFALLSFWGWVLIPLIHLQNKDYGFILCFLLLFGWIITAAVLWEVTAERRNLDPVIMGLTIFLVCMTGYILTTAWVLYFFGML